VEQIGAGIAAGYERIATRRAEELAYRERVRFWMSYRVLRNLAQTANEVREMFAERGMRGPLDDILNAMHRIQNVLATELRNAGGTPPAVLHIAAGDEGGWRRWLPIAAAIIGETNDVNTGTEEGGAA
jgi:hypothetical protein